MENQNIVALICKTILYIISILVWANVIKLAAKEEAAEDHRILKELQKELIRKKRQQKQTEAAPSEKGL